MRAIPDGRAWLFCPADRPDRFSKAADVADVVILDLEDGVASADKEAARRAIGAATGELDPERTVVRVNPVGTEEHARDLSLLASLHLSTIMLAKVEAPSDLAGLSEFSVIALCETSRGVLAAAQIAAVSNCAGLMWGAEDLIADLGGSSSRDSSGTYRDVARYSRAQVLLSASANHRIALDAVYVDIADLDGLRRETEDAVASGFTAKVCIHPAQVPVVRTAFAPSPGEVEWANRVLAAAAQPGARGVVTVDGRMVDEPILRHARRLLDQTTWSGRKPKS